MVLWKLDSQNSKKKKKKKAYVKYKPVLEEENFPFPSSVREKIITPFYPLRLQALSDEI